MRLIRLKLQKDVKQYLKQTARQYAFEDAGFVEDIFALIRLKGNGLPTKERIAKMAKSTAKRRGMAEAGVNLLITKRKLTFVKMLGLPYTHALMTLPDPIDATVRFITKMRQLYTKVRQAQCLSCHLNSQCEFGKQYGEAVIDITKVIDPDFEKKVHDDCPLKPEIGGLNMFIAAVTAMNSMVNSVGTPEQAIAEDLCAKDDVCRSGPETASFAGFNEQADVLQESGFAATEDSSTVEDQEADFHVPGQTSSSNSGVYDGSHSGNALCKVSEELIENLTIQQLSIFELGRKFSTELTQQKKGKFKPVTEIEHDKRNEQMESMSDVTRLTPSQFALPNEVFDARLEKKSLIKTQHLRPETNKQILYLLQDNSASMTAFLGGAKRGLFTRGALSAIFCIALVRRAQADGGVVYHRFFTGNVSKLVKAKTPEEYEFLLSYLGTPSFRSGSTNIPAVVETACQDVEEANDDLKKTEILLVTDCEDTFNEKSLKSLLKGAELNTLDVAGGSINSSEAQCLRRLSNKYYKANEAAANIADIVKIV